MIELSPYQAEAARFLLGRERVCLFDEQGVGKTLPAIDAAWSVRHREWPLKAPILITAPAYLLPNWKFEIERYLRGRNVTWRGVQIVDGATPTEKHRQLSTQTHDFVLVSYHLWALFDKGQPRYPELHKRPWPVLIFDEAHRMRGRNSKWTQKLWQLQNTDRKTKASYFWMLTGTPMVRDPGDLFPLLKLCDRNRFTSYWRFVEEWCKLDVTPWATEVGQLKPGLEEPFNAMVREYSLRRTLDSIPELASLPVVYDEIRVELQPSVYKMLRDSTREWVIEHPDLDEPEAMESAGALVTRLRQYTAVPPTQENRKLDALVDLLEDNREPVIVWCWYRNTANAIIERLGNRGRPLFRFTGDSTAKEKVEALQGFGAAVDWAEPPILVATIAAMKEGVNLQCAALQVFMEESELPADNEQAIARSRRRGQTKPVRVVHIHANRSIDEKVHRAAESRAQGFRRAMLEELVREL